MTFEPQRSKLELAGLPIGSSALTRAVLQEVFQILKPVGLDGSWTQLEGNKDMRITEQKRRLALENTQEEVTVWVDASVLDRGLQRWIALDFQQPNLEEVPTAEAGDWRVFLRGESGSIVLGDGEATVSLGVVLLLKYATAIGELVSSTIAAQVEVRGTAIPDINADRVLIQLNAARVRWEDRVIEPRLTGVILRAVLARIPFFPSLPVMTSFLMPWFDFRRQVAQFVLSSVEIVPGKLKLGMKFFESDLSRRPEPG
ncbi:MAG: hypothetical protein KME03_14100 [Aphanocapsa lilacina HA4352-LM1]|jgi:hypothetical protein|nr:hypothetical protein [Aphanocapsa lilacina HA4352-LM1]